MPPHQHTIHSGKKDLGNQRYEGTSFSPRETNIHTDRAEAQSDVKQGTGTDEIGEM